MPKKMRHGILHCALGIMGLAVACSGVPETTGPTDDIRVVEVRVANPAGTEHVQVLVPAGAFRMGWAEGPESERPVHDVELDAFYIDKYEVTNAQYQSFVQHGGGEQTRFSAEAAYNQPQQPAVGVFWHQARNYCEWAGGQLPTEAQWEKAAGGTDGRFFPWGNDIPNATRANFNFSAGPLPVGRHPGGASPYGAHDMAGNAWEWTLDEFSATFYARSPRNNPVNLEVSGLEEGPDRTLRGGGWISQDLDLRVSVRTTRPRLEERAETEFWDWDKYAAIFASIGFRCARPVR